MRPAGELPASSTMVTMAYKDKIWEVNVFKTKVPHKFLWLSTVRGTVANSVCQGCSKE